MKELLYILLICLAVSACELEEININPNDPEDVPMSTLLPPAQSRIADIMAEDAAVISGIFVQYFLGRDALVQPIEKYVVDNNFFMNPVWGDFYVTAMPTLDIIIDKADSEGSPHYGGVAKVLMAYCLGTASSLWGDMPYTEAFRYESNLSPTFDSQESIYSSIQHLLDEAIIDLQSNESVFSPGTDDVIYNGDLDRWISLARMLKARYLMHLVKRDESVAAEALVHLEQAFDSSEDDFEFVYNTSQFNPWYQYQLSTPYIRIDAQFLDKIDDDPREAYMVKSSFGEKSIGPYYASQESPLILASYFEQEFLRAEALIRTGRNGAQEALENAIRSHMEKVSGGDITSDEVEAYITANAQLGGSREADLRTILNQKHIAMFLQIEAWTDYRRTGFPDLDANANGDNPQNPGGSIPRRFPYPINEELFNINVPSPSPSLQQRFWWDL